MNVLGIIPARYGSTRFPGKPLALIHGKSMIRRVYERAKECPLITHLTVATDDQRIFDHVKSFGGNVLMTAVDHPNGTSRCLEVLEKSADHVDMVINIQGDEPYLHPSQIEELIQCLESGGTAVATLVKRIMNTDELDNPNVVKVVRQLTGLALYFSRFPIPYCKPEQRMELLEKGVFLKHIGLYAYRPRMLKLLPSMLEGSLEKAESLEQLRWLEQGVYIATALTEHENHAVDSPEDVIRLEQLFEK